MPRIADVLVSTEQEVVTGLLRSVTVCMNIPSLPAKEAGAGCVKHHFEIPKHLKEIAGHLVVI